MVAQELVDAAPWDLRPRTLHLDRLLRGCGELPPLSFDARIATIPCI